MLKRAESDFTTSTPKPLIGSLGYLTVFLWALGMILLPFDLLGKSQSGMIFTVLVSTALGFLYPFAFRRLMRLRWLLILASLLAVNLSLGGQGQPPDWTVWGLPVSSVAVLSGVQMTLRAIVILMAADGLSASVNISEIAGLFERGGLRGLGFSIGVATNLLPDLRTASITTWHSLRMRGGLRADLLNRSWWRGLRLLVLTIVTNALRHAEQIVLAAEVRAFQPELSRKVPLRKGALDWWLAALGIVSFLAALYFSLH